MHNASLTSNTGNATATQGGSTGPAVVSATKDADDALISWRRGRRDPTQYPILENDNEYTDWIIKMTRQFKSEECERMIDENFKDNKVAGDAENDLFIAQVNLVSIVLERVLKTTNGMRLTRKHVNDPREIYRLHEEHQRRLVTSARITTSLSMDLANMKVADFLSPTKCLDSFNSKLEKFNLISTDLNGNS